MSACSLAVIVPSGPAGIAAVSNSSRGSSPVPPTLEPGVGGHHRAVARAERRGIRQEFALKEVGGRDEVIYVDAIVVPLSEVLPRLGELEGLVIVGDESSPSEHRG